MGSSEREGASELAAAWARTLTRLKDPQLQVGWLRERLTQVGAARAADVLTVVLARAELREERFGVLLLRASLALEAAELRDLRRAIAGIAAVREQRGLAQFLCVDEVAGASADAVDGEPERDDVTRATDASRGRPLSLGERKSLARKRDRDLLARVLRDPHPDVVRILLDNPAITELDVIRLCARRPIAREALAQVFRHTRWIVRYRVRLALALNPYTPEAITLQLLPHLTPHDLREVRRSGDISERVRAACSLAERRVLH